ncbi:nucleotidyltransferase family protein [Candidatus Bathyarchaeota archaeon]|nr:MAG: nucleotidyltransferase family protein [Candidatus Bathyarchaeota archaeon]
MKLNFLEEIGGVKTARREAESLLLATALLRNDRITVRDEGRMLKLARKNKVLLRAADLIHLPSNVIDEAKKDVDEAFDLYDRMSGVFAKHGISFVAIKSFDSLPDIGHDIDLLVASPSELAEAEKILVNEYRVRPQGLTHCDRLLGKFSCFLPGYKHDFELYPTISQLGETHLDPTQVLLHRKKTSIEGHVVWMTSDSDRVLIRIIHAMFRHNFLKLSDILDFLKLIETADSQEVIEKISNARIGDAFIFYLLSIERFLKACRVENPGFQLLKRQAQERFGNDRLTFLRRDRLVLPYRIPASAIIMLFLLKAARDAASARWRSSISCLVAPPLIILDFISAAFRAGGRGGVW